MNTEQGRKAAVGVLLIAAVVLPLAAGARSEVREPCMDEKMREKVRAIMLDGIDLALKDHTKHIYEVWMKDAADQPRRAATGMNMGVSAYVRARTTALAWSPPPCPAKP